MFFVQDVVRKDDVAYIVRELAFRAAYCAKMVGLPGLEPGTSPLSGVHSNQLSYRPILECF